MAESGKLGTLGIENFKNVENEVEVLDLLRNKITSVLHTTLELNRATRRQSDKSVFIEDVATLESLSKILNNREVAINNELGLAGSTSNRFDFNNVWNMTYYLKNRIVNKKVAEFSRIFDRDHKDNKLVFNALLESGILQSSDGLNLDPVRIQSIDQIKIVDSNYKPLKDSKLISDNKLLISSVLEVLGAKGQYNTTEAPVTMTIDQVRNLKGFLNSQGINVEPTSLANFSTETVRRITYQNFKDSKLNTEDIGIFQAFYSLGTTDPKHKFSLMKYDQPSKGRPVGIIANQIEFLGTDPHIQKIVKEYNTYVSELVNRGKVDGKEGFVKTGSKYTLTDESAIYTIQSILHDAKISSNQSAKKELMNFMMSNIGKNKARDAALTFMSAYPQEMSKLTRLLINTGVLELKPGEGQHKGTSEYYISKEKFGDKEIQKKIINFIERYGINSDTLDVMTTRAQKDLEMYLEEMYSPGDTKTTMTTQKFFTDYISKDIDTSTPKKMNDWLNNKLYGARGEFRGFQAINDILTELNIPKGQEARAHQDLLQLLSNKLQGTTKKIFYFSDGEVRAKDTDLQSYRTPYFEMLDKIGIKYALIDGMSHDWVLHPMYGNISHQPLDLFQSEANITNRTQRKMVRDRKALFLEMLKKKTDIEGFENGIELIEMPGLKLSLAVSKGNLNEIKTAFEAMYKRHIGNMTEGSVAESKLKDYKEKLEATTEFGPVVNEVFRALIAETMFTGKNKSQFEKMLGANEADLNKYFVGRQTLFNTMKFKRVDPELMTAHSQSNLTTTMSFQEYQANSHYRKQNKFGVAIFDDSLPSFNLKTMFEAENGQGSWAKYYGSRKSESSHDSISFISKRMADFLGLHYGANGSRVFKPVISSQGEGSLLYGKTEFVYDPKLQKFFDQNPNLDILMAASAEKLKLYQDVNQNNVATDMLQIPKESFYTTGAINQNKIIDIPLNAVGIQKIPDQFKLAKISPSVINNHTDVDLAKRIYADYYATDIARNMENIRELLDNPFLERELMKQLKKGMTSGKVEDMELLEGSDFNSSLHLEWLNISPYSSLDVFGSNAKMNPLKSKFLDKIMAPSSTYKYKGESYNFGGKSTLMQTMGESLKPTKFNHETGKIEQYGEIMLPHEVGAETINFKGRNFKVKVIDKNNNVLDAETIFKKYSEFKNFKWSDIVNGDRPLEALFNVFERGALKDYDIAISVMRYPRTRPNDLTLLRLKGFVDRASHNAAVVNPFDVYHIFEGDYDIDAIDYFWAGSNAWYRNIKRQQKVFVPTADVSGATEVLPEIELLSKNPAKSNKEWGVLNGNQRALAGTRGLVQATSSLVKHIDNIAEARPDGRKVLLQNPNIKKGENGYWEVEIDWNNSDFHLRQALEGQILLDATSPDASILKSVMNWRYDFMFPSMKESFAREHFVKEDGSYNTNSLRNFISRKKSGQEDFDNKRVRLFRRYEWTRKDGELVREEVNLREIDKDIIQAIMKQYSQLLEVTPGRKVHTAGNSSTAQYDDILMRSKKYFSHAEDFRRNIFYKILNKQDYENVRTGAKYKYQGQNANGNDLREYFNYKNYTYKDKNNNIRYDKTKKFSTSSPFARGVEDNMRARSKGTEGGVVEKMLYEIWSKDPLNSLHLDTKILTNDAYVKEKYLERQLLHSDDFKPSEWNNFMPQLIGSINHDIDVIKRLKIKWVQLNKTWVKGKKQKLDELNNRIKEMEDKLKPLLTKEYYKSRKAKDIGRPNTVDIQSDKNIIDATSQYYTLNHLARFAVNNNLPGYKQDLLDLRTFIGKEYNVMDSYGDYKRKTMHTTELEASLSNVKSSKEIELSAENMLTRGVFKHGIKFLWDFAMPSVSSIQNNIGIFNGNVMPVSVKPGGNYKRAVRWLLKGHAGLLDQSIYNSFPREHFTKVLENLAEIDFVWRRYFNGQNKHLPLDATELSKMLTYGAPKWDWKMNNMFSNYTDIKIEKPLNEFNPFGMGRKYDMNIEFFRALSKLDRTIGGNDFEGGIERLSYTNQLMMENGYMLPQKHIALLSDVSSKLGPTMEKVFPSQIDIKSGRVQPLKPFDLLSNPLYVLLGGGHMNGSGLTLDPWRAMSKYEQRSVDKMINQVENMRDVKKDYWKEAFFNTDKRLDITKTKGDC